MLEVNGFLDDYIQESDVIDFDNFDILRIAEYIRSESLDNLDLVRRTFEYVRDNIDHSGDIRGKVVTCKASDVIRYREGFCYAKSHLLAALLRANRIPCGFCYQRLILDDESAPYLILHGLNAVYIEEVDRWIRLDARGNKPGVKAEFSMNNEKLAFNVRNELGEEDIMIIYPEPDNNVVEKLMYHDKVNELFKDLPKELSQR